MDAAKMGVYRGLITGNQSPGSCNKIKYPLPVSFFGWMPDL